LDQHVKLFEMCYVKEQVSVIVKIHMDSTKKRFKTNWSCLVTLKSLFVWHTFHPCVGNGAHCTQVYTMLTYVCFAFMDVVKLSIVLFLDCLLYSSLDLAFNVQFFDQPLQ